MEANSSRIVFSPRERPYGSGTPCEIAFADFGHARPAILAVKHAEKHPHDRTPLFDRRLQYQSSVSGCLRGLRKMVSRVLQHHFVRGTVTRLTRSKARLPVGCRASTLMSCNAHKSQNGTPSSMQQCVASKQHLSKKPRSRSLPPLRIHFAVRTMSTVACLAM